MRKTIALLALAAVLAGCAREEKDLIEQIPVVPEQTGRTWVPGLAMVKFADEMMPSLEGAEGVRTKSETLNEALSALGAYALERVIPDAGEWEPRHEAAGLHRWYRVRYDASVPRTKAEASLGAVHGVEVAEGLPRKKRHAFTYFNDPYLFYQWHYMNDGTLGNRGFKKGIDINVVPVWEEFTAGSKNVIVAVVDGGVQRTHPDLQGVVIAPGENGSRNFVEGYAEYDVRGDSHGTHVAGTIAAVGNNSVGVAGIAGGRDGTGGVKILSCQIFVDVEGQDYPDSGGDTEQALVWAADHGAVICNNSWGYEYESIADARAGRLPAFCRECIDYFVRNAGLDVTSTTQTGPMVGGVVFFSAGNENWPYGQPASYQNVVAVSAIGPDGSRASYSNYGDWVDIAAPGGDDVPGANSHYGYVMSLTNGGSYAWMAGTSMACPHVTGVAALLVSYYGGPGFTREQLLDRLLYGANYDATYHADKPVGPLVDAYGAMTYDPKQTAPRIRAMYPEDLVTGDDEITLRSHETVTVPVTISGNASHKYTIQVEPGSEALSFTETEDGGVDLKIEALKAAPGRYTAVVEAGFDADNMGRMAFDYVIRENHAPVVVGEPGYRIIEKQGQATTIFVDMAAYVSDEDGEVPRMSCTVDNDLVETSIAGTTVALRAVSLGRARATVTATDARGASCELSFDLYVADAKAAPAVGPNPVADYLYVSKGALHDLTLILSTATGAEVFNDVLSGDLVNPAVLDMRSYAPGRYVLTVQVDGQEYQSVITKK